MASVGVKGLNKEYTKHIGPSHAVQHLFQVELISNIIRMACA